MNHPNICSRLLSVLASLKEKLFGKVLVFSVPHILNYYKIMEKQKTGKVEGTEFLPSFLKDENVFDDVETENGLLLNNVYIPEEIVLYILSYVDSKELLGHSLVCRKWNSIIKSYALWSTIYKRKCNKKPKQLPWYLYYCYFSTKFFDNNLLLNGNGQNGFQHWHFKANGGDKCRIEDPPEGADPLPADVPDFYNKTSCFATSYGTCYKIQRINLGNSKLFRYILDNYKPHIYLSEWTAGRFDCGCIYKLACGFLGNNVVDNSDSNATPYGINRVEQWQGAKWKKIEVTVMGYPEGIEGIVFEHEGRDTQFWAGHYGSKMAGGVAKLLFDSIEPLPTDEAGNEIPKRFTKVEYVTNGDSVSHGNGRIAIWHDFNYEDDMIGIYENLSDEENIGDDHDNDQEDDQHHGNVIFRF